MKSSVQTTMVLPTVKLAPAQKDSTARQKPAVTQYWQPFCRRSLRAAAKK